ncbi:period circadian protein homolog 2 isoform X2 [Notamacropus eugenii]|uniref:period circadian protein homolog 2 isoform X2 n=1 Tax=Notamacropus eugenii TaxID=9315 RepID=UPI003B67BDBD
MNECSEVASDHCSGTEGQRKPRPNAAALQDIEMSSGSSGNEINENDFSGRESPGNDSDENGKDSAMLVESSESHKSSNAFSLMIVNSDRNLSTSGCSSEQSAKAKTQKELIKTLKELKGHLPLDRKTKGKSSMLATLKYALRSIKQIKANEEYYQLLMTSDNHSADLDVPSYTVQEIETLTSEYIMKNVDMFAMAVSLVTGKIVYVSDQATSILPCKKDTFHNAKFVEFLAPHDVSVFHGSTAPSRLPAWRVCRRADSSTQDYMEEKSFFCRIGGGRDHENITRYHPFRMTPYLLRVQEERSAETQLCCVLLAEKVHSGYEAPRIPPDKRIFTTTHTPNCLFQDVDERAVPLLGYLPQDLIGTPLLLHLHPHDRPLMLAIHKKILQYGGQPFDYSPIRFCTRNGEYITMDTSWSSFINPWNRKVSFIIGRHKVRTGPLNEDVFAVHSCTEEKTPHPSVQEITEQIYRLLLQPVHNSGSSGYGSLGSNGSHEHLMSQTSSSDSNGHLHEDLRKRRPNARKGIGKDAQKVTGKSAIPLESEDMRKPASESQTHLIGQTKTVLAPEKDSGGPGLPKNVMTEELACRNQSAYSYQQISCLDSVIRYLESCSVAGPLKRKCESLPGVADDQKPVAESGPPPATEETPVVKVPLSPAVAILKPSKANGRPAVGAHLTPLALPGKAESVVSFTSQCSYSSTLVHVGDKKLQPESEMIEDPASGVESLDSAAAPSSHCDSSLEKGPPKKVGLTKEVLAVHTQREEQSFLHKFKETRRLSTFQSRCHYYLQERSKGRSGERVVRGPRNSISGMDSSWKKSGKNRKQKSKRIKPQESSDSTTSGTHIPPRSLLVGLNSTAWSPSDTSQASCPPASFPSVVPAYSLPVFPSPGIVPASGEGSSASQAHGHDSGNSQHYISLQPPAFTAPLTPVMAVVLPNYTFPTMNPTGHPPFYPGQSNCSQHPACASQMVFAAQPDFPVQTSCSSQTFCPAQSYNYQPSERERPPASGGPEGPSRSMTPQSTGRQDQASPPLFQSRCSSPLQLNLLQLEEMPKTSESTMAAVAASLAGHGLLSEGSNNKTVEFDDGKRAVPHRIDSPMDAHNSDVLSMSSDLLEILLAEDGGSATGSASSGSGVSAASESLGSGSLGCGTSRTGTGSSETSHTSKYFGSVDSSEDSHRAKVDAGLPGSGHFLKCVLQDPVWLLMANTNNDVMMTYQLPARNLEAVLKEDRERLKVMQKLQPKFTDEQKRELHAVHTWMPRGGLPRALDVVMCPDCEDSQRDRVDGPYDEDLPAMELSEMMTTQGEKGVQPTPRGTKEET